jgi:hypothetical protein
MLNGREGVVYKVNSIAYVIHAKFWALMIWSRHGGVFFIARVETLS